MDGIGIHTLRYCDRIGDWQFVKAKTKALGGRVVLTNGCFDVLHPGHVTGLEMARELGHVLVVSVDHDDLARQAKGDERPFQHWTDRMQVVAGLASVGLVTWHGGSHGSLHDLMKYLRPSVWARRAEVPTAELEACELYGIEDVVIERLGDYNSTGIIERMLADEADVMEFSPRQIKAIRLALGLTQPDFGKLVGVSVKTVCHWERGRSRPQVHYLPNLRKASRRVALTVANQ